MNWDDSVGDDTSLDGIWHDAVSCTSNFSLHKSKRAMSWNLQTYGISYPNCTANHTSRTPVANRAPFPESPSLGAVCAVSRLCVKKVSPKGFKACTTLFGMVCSALLAGWKGRVGSDISLDGTWCDAVSRALNVSRRSIMEE